MFSQAALAYRNAGKSARFLEPVENYWRDQLVNTIKPSAIRAAAIKHFPNGAAATRNRQFITPTQAIINFAADLEWCNPIKVKRFPVVTKEKTPVTNDWVQAFVAHASPHLGALCLFMFGTGARKGEAVALTWADVDLDGRTALIRQTKINDERIAHLQGPVIEAIANIPSNRNLTDPVFQYVAADSVRSSWDLVTERAGIENLSPHCCRHGFATTMLQAGIDAKTVAKMGGWKDVATLMKTYAHALEDKTVTDVIFGTKLTQGQFDQPLTHSKKRKIS